MKPSLIAHRGALNEAPENTLSAFKLALNHLVDFVEFDIRLTKENIPVVIHDPLINDIPIHEQTLKELQKHDVNDKFKNIFPKERIPTFEEVLQLDWKQTGLMIEIKECPQASEIVVKAVFELLKKYRIDQKGSKLIMGSFSINIVLEIQKQARLYHIPIQTIGIVEEEKYISPFISCKVDILGIWLPLLKQSLIDEISQKNILVWGFTVETLNDVSQIKSLPVDGIISNILPF